MPDIPPNPAVLIEASRNAAMLPTSAVPGEPTRDAHGRFLNGNRSAVSHGLHAEQLPDEFAHLRTDVDAFIAGSVADDGGDTEISTRRRALLNYRARLHRRILQLDHALELRGLVDKRNKLRVTWLSALAQFISAAKGLDVLLGLERRPRRTATLAEYLGQSSDGTLDILDMPQDAGPSTAQAPAADAQRAGE